MTPTHFCYKATGEFVFCYSEEEAKSVAENSLEEARYNSQNMGDDDLWPEYIEKLCWGEIKSRAVEARTRDYQLAIAIKVKK